jgi:beta-lactamase superfamily II metal-dependent hydrolase
VPCEVEFLPVGDASKAGDAIVVRYGSEASFKLMTIDGGTQDSGEQLVAHVRRYYGNSPTIEHAVLTHSDADHASGLREILRELPVVNLWLHVPWLAAAASRPYFANKNWTDGGLATSLRKEYDIIDEIVSLAVEQKTHIYQPFAGNDIGPFKVLSPYADAYPLLLSQFDRTPDPDQAALERIGWWIGKQPSRLMKALTSLTESMTQKWVKETWSYERLKDGGKAGASNESSVVMFGDFGPSHRILLTGDAGVVGLTLAQRYAESIGLNITNPNCIQIPHHGSRSNVGPTLLNQLIGPIKPDGSAPHFLAYCSVPADDAKHPRKMVLNAFTRRGAEVLLTQGIRKVFWGGFSPRPGYEPAFGFPFSDQVEEYD